MLQTALDIGVPEREFWDMTLGEIGRVIESHNRREQQRMKERAAWDYRLAELIGSSVSRLFGGKYPPIQDAYPGLFEAADRRQDWRVAKERLLAYATQHNKKRKEGKS